MRALEGVLAAVRIAVQDWRPMLARASEVAANLKANPPPLAADEIAEAIQFLQWIAADNFTLLGARDHTYADTGKVTISLTVAWHAQFSLDNGATWTDVDTVALTGPQTTHVLQVMQSRGVLVVPPRH